MVSNLRSVCGKGKKSMVRMSHVTLCTVDHNFFSASSLYEKNSHSPCTNRFLIMMEANKRRNWMKYKLMIIFRVHRCQSDTCPSLLTSFPLWKLTSPLDSTIIIKYHLNTKAQFTHYKSLSRDFIMT